MASKVTFLQALVEICIPQSAVILYFTWLLSFSDFGNLLQCEKPDHGVEPYFSDGIREPILYIFMIFTDVQNMLQVFPLTAHQDLRLVRLRCSPYGFFPLWKILWILRWLLRRLRRCVVLLLSHWPLYTRLQDILSGILSHFFMGTVFWFSSVTSKGPSATGDNWSFFTLSCRPPKKNVFVEGKHVAPFRVVSCYFGAFGKTLL